MKEVMRKEVATTKLYLIFIAVFAGLAIVLAAIGIYGVASYLARIREREIGIRLALGAGANSIVRLIFRQSIWPALSGVAIGVGASLVGTELIRSLLYDVEPRDPAVLGFVAAILFVIAVAATIRPAVRATHVDPVEVMKSQ